MNCVGPDALVRAGEHSSPGFGGQASGKPGVFCWLGRWKTGRALPGWAGEGTRPYVFSVKSSIL